MCGIAGFTHNNPKIQPNNILNSMIQSLAHRGPDASMSWTSHCISLVHCRLSIIDLSINANQPMEDAFGEYILVFNGEIYNHLEIRQKLKDYPFKTNSDSEVILAAFRHWREKCLQYFNGMFAFAIWEKKTETLFIARDRLGIKPLYYYQSPKNLFFSSEIRALLKSNIIKKNISHQGLSDYLQYQTVYSPSTIIEGIKQLPAGHFATFSNEKLSIQSYWQPSFTNLGTTDIKEIKNTIRNLFFNAVKRRMISDVPLGAFLSGGIDSTAVVATMSQLSSSPIETFSVIFGEKQYNEAPYSDLVSKKYNTKHHPILLKPSDFLKTLPDALRAMDHPSGDGVNSYVVAKVTKNAGITVALSGLGGDELFAGYPVFQQYYDFRKKSAFWKLPQNIRKVVAQGIALGIEKHQRTRLISILSTLNFSVIDIYPFFRQIFSKNETQLLIRSRLSNGYFNGLNENLKEFPILSQISLAEINTYTQNVLLQDTDQMSMAHALEVRVPFFDHKLVEYVLNISDNHKFPYTPKVLLTEALHPLIPKEIIHRKKMGFSFPWNLWLKNELKEFCQSSLSSLSKRPQFVKSEVNKLWAAFIKGKKNALWLKIWLLVVLEEWFQNNGI